MSHISNLQETNKGLYRISLKEDADVVVSGDYGYGTKRHFVIVCNSLGFPCAYLEVKNNDWAEKNKQSEPDCCDPYDMFEGWVHGGYTYYGKAYWDKEDNRTYVGWDYGHCDDYSPSMPKCDGHKWTIYEILMDVAQAYIGIFEQNESHYE